MVLDQTPAASASPQSGDTLFASLTRPALAESTAAQLRRYLIEHQLRPGDRLPGETTLATEVGASRLTVREGLRALEALGLVESRVGSGWYVRGFDVSHAAHQFAWSLAFHPSALADLLAIRRATEAAAVAALAGNVAAPDLDVMDDLADRMRWQASRGRLFVAEDREFHTRLYAASGNRIALALMDVYWSLLEAMYQHGLPRQDPLLAPGVADAHGRIVTALRQEDGPLAASVLLESHEESQHRVEAWLSEQQAGEARSDSSVQAAIHAALRLREAAAR